jgi:phosphoribosylformylglycinamidine synthase
MAGVRAFRLDGVPDLSCGSNPSDRTHPSYCLKALLASHSIASKNWVYRQYDHMVRDGSIVCPGSDAAVIRIKSDSLPITKDEYAAQRSGKSEIANRKSEIPEKYVAFTCDCNGGYVYLDPYEGGKAAVTEACRNLACSGAVPVGSTDNLNFGNPHNPEIFWQLKESVRGLSEGCKAFNAPVTGGNVSLYNQRGALGAIDPTPTVAVVGIVEKPEHITTQWFKDAGDVIVLLGTPVDTADPLQGLGGSAYLQTLHQTKNGLPPRVNLDAAVTLHNATLTFIRNGWVKSAHDCSEGGLAVALAESCFSQLIAKDTPRFIGASVDLRQCAAGILPAEPSERGPKSENFRQDAGSTLRLDALLFGETQNRIVISANAANADTLLAEAAKLGVPAQRLGVVGGDKLVIKTAAGEFSTSVAELHDPWWNSIARAMA